MYLLEYSIYLFKQTESLPALLELQYCLIYVDTFDQLSLGTVA